MRPVKKGRGTGYVPPATFKWNQKHDGKDTAAWKALSAITNDSSSPLVLTLAKCWEIATDAVKVPNPTPNQTIALKAILAKVSDVYKLATVPLATAVGPFCAYCETAIPGLIEVDHVAPKSEYPKFSTDWDNFLPACGPCNNTKSATPTRDEVLAFPPKTGFLTEDQFRHRIREHYEWPDINKGTFQDMPNVLCMNNVMWEEVSLKDSVNLGDNHLVSFDMSTRVVKANLICRRQPYDKVDVYVLVFPLNASIVKLVGLNRPPNAASTYDRRAFNRTIRWFQMLDFIRPITQIKDEQQFRLFWPLLQMAAATSGFWSSWIRALSQFPAFGRNGSLAWWYYHADNASLYYPGTNTDAIVLPPAS